METLHFSTVIDAPKEDVWTAMLDDASYRSWTEAFAAGSHYVGDWREGSKILFLAPDKATGKHSGMVSRIAENRPFERITIEHIGIVHDGVEDTTSETARKWAPAIERYTLVESDGGTEVRVEMEVEPEHSEMFETSWPEALRRLKSLAET